MLDALDFTLSMMVSIQMKCLEFDLLMHKGAQAGRFGENKETFNDGDDSFDGVYDAENN